MKQCECLMLTVCDSKTGVTLKDTGRRDEHGMEPLDSLFSSPEKTNTKGKAAEYEEEDEEDDESSDGGMEMDIDYSMLDWPMTPRAAAIRQTVAS